MDYEEIAFVDDQSPMAIAKISDVERLEAQYQEAFVGIGNNKLRGELICRLQDYDYTIPTLIHLTAYISRTAEIEMGTVIEPKVIVNAHTYVGKGCIISVGAIVDHDVRIEDFCHVNARAI